MWTAHKLTAGKSAGYGFGWVPESLGAQRVVYHNGGGCGFNNANYRFLNTGLTVIVLTNLQVESTGISHADAIARRIAAAYSPDLDLWSVQRKEVPPKKK